MSCKSTFTPSSFEGLSLKALSLSCSVLTKCQKQLHPTPWCETTMPQLSCWIALAYPADGGHSRGCQAKDYVEGTCWEALLPYSGSQILVRNYLLKVPLLSLSWCQGITTLQALTCYIHSQQGFYVQSHCR